MTRPDDDAIAIVGMAGRFPGAPDLATYWDNLAGGVDSIRTWTDDELHAAGIGADLIADPAYVPAGGHLAGIEDFDAAFFGVPDDEARRLDPQHRLFLEVAWAAMEDAGHDPGRYPGAVGVFAGASPNRYLMFHLLRSGSAHPDDWEGSLVQTSATDYLPARVSYALGLTGPSVAVQAACATALVAVCQAAASLQDYRCDMAIAGASSIASTRPAGYRADGTLLSSDGRCRPFDAAANGAVPGSGVGAVVLKRYGDAVADGDRVAALLRGWAVTNDGAARAGFTAPGVDGQVAAVLEALETAELVADDIGYVEAHGGGTLLGDAIEVDALSQAFRDSSEQLVHCGLGSVKGNVGNLDAAAGIAALLKTVLALGHDTLPPTLHVSEANPHLDLAASPFFLLREPTPWPAARRAGVHSFGVGGTNAHVIVEAPPESDVDDSPVAPVPLALSARSPAALREVCRRLRDHLLAHPDLRLGDVAHTLALGRTAFSHRRALVCTTVPDAVAALARPAGPIEGDDAVAAVARQWEQGGEVAWESVFKPGAHRRLPLPTYPFESRRHWVDPPRSSDG